MTGITHTILAGNKLSIRSRALAFQTKVGFDQDYTEDNMSVTKTYVDKYKTNNWVANTTVNYKFSNRLNLRAGAIAISSGIIFFREMAPEHEGGPLLEKLNETGNTSTQQAFAMAIQTFWQYQFTGGSSLFPARA